MPFSIFSQVERNSPSFLRVAGKLPSPFWERGTSWVRGVLPLISLCELRLPPLLHTVLS